MTTMRVLLGWILLLHALAHASTMAFTPIAQPVWFSTLLLAVAFAGYFAVGLALLRLPWLRLRWKPVMIAASIASMMLLLWLEPVWGVLGVALDVALFIGTEAVMQPRIDAAIEVREVLGAAATDHPRWVRIGWTLGALFLVYGTVVTLGRPTIMRWGSTAEDRVIQLPGDDVLQRDARYTIDHAITIHAPAAAVWPWLVQLGEDRAGFYSYDWLERAIGDHVHNADRIHDEWQARIVGDTILATQRSYLGGRLGTLGWRVSVIQPREVIGLENWGNFVLRSIDSNTTRLLVRTRGSGRATFANFLVAPISVFVLEPAHFIMERAMLRGVRDRAEGRTAQADTSIK